MYNLNVYFLDTSLTITNVLEEHGGLYQCVARSKVGMTHAELYLDVRKPGMSLVHLYIYLGTVLRQVIVCPPGVGISGPLSFPGEGDTVGYG